MVIIAWLELIASIYIHAHQAIEELAQEKCLKPLLVSYVMLGSSALNME